MFKLPLLLVLLGLACLAIRQTPDRSAPAEPRRPRDEPARARRVPAFSSTRAKAASCSSCGAPGRHMARTASTTWFATATTTTRGSSACGRQRGSSSASPRIRRSRPPGARARFRRSARRLERPRNRRLRVQGSQRPDDAGVHQPEDNAATHDGEPFVPFARVIEGMDAADALYSDTARRPAAAFEAASRIRSLPRAMPSSCASSPSSTTSGARRSFDRPRQPGIAPTPGYLMCAVLLRGLDVLACLSASRPSPRHRPAASSRRRRCRP